MKRVKVLCDINKTDNAKVAELSKESGLSIVTSAILLSRGFDTGEKIKAFLNPTRADFNDPFLLDGMTELVNRVKKAKEDGETILVYGDYDADGISAVTILYSALKQMNVKAFYAIPERGDGYGLSLEVIERATDEAVSCGFEYPSLLITVDCGVSDRAVIEEIKGIGMDVIVTDHHEIPEILPDCLVVNPKKKGQTYPFDGLCGAAVAYKTACALIGAAADCYLDFAAVATVADSMPLTGENRAIVSEGLKLLSGKKIRKQFAALLGNSAAKGITSSTLAYTIAPRINAAGRMGSAASALSLFMTDDDHLIYDLGVKLNEYNLERQTECDKLYKAAKEQIKKCGAYGGAVIVASEEWQTGLAGIVAAKLVEEYSRPSIVFAGHADGVFKGSARSIDGVNIFEALSSCKDLLVEFGGHAQAAGVAVKKENMEAFKTAFSDYIIEHYPVEAFDSTINADIALSGHMTIDLAKELDLFEPTGVGNRKPLILIGTRGSVAAAPLKNGSPHISFKTSAAEMLWFNMASSLDKLLLPVGKKVLFEPNISVFNGRESLKGFVREVVITPDFKSAEVADAALYGDLLTLENGGEFSYNKKAQPDFEKLKTRRYGVCYIAYNAATAEKYGVQLGVEEDLFEPSDRTLRSRIILSPYRFDALEDYAAFVFLDKPIGDFPIIYGKEIYVVDDDIKQNILSEMDCSREKFGEIFKILKALSGKPCSDALSAYYLADKPKCGEFEFFAAFEVFKELGFLFIDGGTLRFNNEARAQLDASELYQTVKRVKLCQTSLKD